MLTLLAPPAEIAAWSAEELFLRLAQHLARWEHLDDAVTAAEDTADLWFRLHPEVPPQRRLN